MKKYLLLAVAMFALLAPPAFAAKVTVQSPVGIWDNSTGVLQGFGIPGQGQNGYTAVQTLNVGGGISLPDGSVATPALNFTSDTDVGLYHIGANHAGFGINGAKVLDLSTAGLGITGTTISSGLTTTAGVNSSDNLTMTAAAKGLVLKQGANGRAGTFICTSGGTIVVSNSSYAVTDTVGTSLNALGGSITAPPFTIANSAGVSFSMKCATSDTSTYNYTLTGNAP